jgi:glycosyltransferase involved in cell wall biosynthesis
MNFENQSIENGRSSSQIAVSLSSHPVSSTILFIIARITAKAQALRTGFNLAKGDFVVVQDADLGYNPTGYPEIIAKLAKKDAEYLRDGISCYCRTYEKGRKIGWRDGTTALYTIINIIYFGKISCWMWPAVARTGSTQLYRQFASLCASPFSLFPWG